MPVNADKLSAQRPPIVESSAFEDREASPVGASTSNDVFMDEVADIGGGVSSSQIAQLICSNRALLHDALSRKQYFIPSLKSSLCSHIYLREVRLRKIYAIKTQDVRRLNCTRPPTVSQAT